MHGTAFCTRLFDRALARCAFTAPQHNEHEAVDQAGKVDFGGSPIAALVAGL